jgi:hypothetical protein
MSGRDRFVDEYPHLTVRHNSCNLVPYHTEDQYVSKSKAPRSTTRHNSRKHVPYPYHIEAQYVSKSQAVKQVSKSVATIAFYFSNIPSDFSYIELH